MIDFNEYTKINTGKQVLISTTGGQIGGVLTGTVTGQDGSITALIVKQYLHRIQVPTEDILNVRIL